MRPADPPRSAFCRVPLLLLLLLLLFSLFFFSAISKADANLLRCATVLRVLIIYVLSCTCGPQGCKNRPAPFSARTLNPIHSTIHHGWSLYKASFSTGMLGLSCFQSWSWCFKAWSRSRSYKTESCFYIPVSVHASKTRNSVIAVIPCDAFRSQSRSPNMVPFHMLRMVSNYCALVTLSVFIEIWLQKCRDLENRVKGPWKSLKIRHRAYDFLLMFCCNYGFRVVSKIFSVDKSCDLEISVKSQSRSLKVVPFERLDVL